MTVDDVFPGVMADFRYGPARGVVVDSPPGAGKSTLVVRAAQHLANAGERLAVVAQTNEQVDDLIDNLATAAPELAIGRLSAQGYVPVARIARHRRVAVDTAPAGLAGTRVIVSTAAKWATLTDGDWPWAIVDEAYQMRSDALLRIAGRFERTLFVGDPGQLDPFSTVENGSSCPGSPTNSARSNRDASVSSASERIWYASSTMAWCQAGTSLT